MLDHIKHIFNDLIDLFFPPTCLVCSDYLDREVLICKKCLSSLNIHNNTEPDYIAVFQYDNNIRILIHELKYNNRPQVGYILGREMAKKLLNIVNNENSVLLPVPLHKKRIKKRGFNQSRKICEGFSDILNIPVIDDLILRKKDNISQTRLNSHRRSQNVKGIFCSGPQKIGKDKMILIVDDLITTGSTTREIGKTLKTSGYRNYFSLCAATSTKNDKVIQ
ncbi:MAG: ComF family protein [Candidatus Delongbacteria bacterium]